MAQIQKKLAALKLAWVTTQVVAAPQLILCPTELVYAATFTTREESQRTSFPDATRFEDITAAQEDLRSETKIQKVFHEDLFTGFFVTDSVIGKHLLIDYTITFDAAGAVQRVDILEYRENYGAEVADRSWLDTFSGKNNQTFQRGAEIPNITGATFSAMHITEGVKEIAAKIESILHNAR